MMPTHTYSMLHADAVARHRQDAAEHKHRCVSLHQCPVECWRVGDTDNDLVIVSFAVDVGMVSFYCVFISLKRDDQRACEDNHKISHASAAVKYLECVHCPPKWSTSLECVPSRGCGL